MWNIFCVINFNFFISLLTRVLPARFPFIVIVVALWLFADPLNMCPVPFLVFISLVLAIFTTFHFIILLLHNIHPISVLDSRFLTLQRNTQKNCNNVYLPFSIRKQRSLEGEKSKKDSPAVCWKLLISLRLQ